MTPAKVLLDTDVLSALMRQRFPAVATSQEYLEAHGYLTFSVVNRYEILRGLKVKDAMRQISVFEQLCAASEVLPLTDVIFVRAAEIYADLYRRGELIGEADILIAATAQEHGLIVATNNTEHFARIRSLSIENWLAPGRQ
jgi:tRNA(fMet)-specific endonuclease VapC